MNDHSRTKSACKREMGSNEFYWSGLVNKSYSVLSGVMQNLRLPWSADQ